MSDEKVLALLFFVLLSTVLWVARMILLAEHIYSTKTVKVLAFLGTITGLPVLIWAYNAVIFG